MNWLFKLLLGSALFAIVGESAIIFWAMSTHSPTLPQEVADASIVADLATDAAESPTFRDGVFERTYRSDAGQSAPYQSDRCPDCLEHPDEPTSAE